MLHLKFVFVAIASSVVAAKDATPKTRNMNWVDIKSPTMNPMLNPTLSPSEDGGDPTLNPKLYYLL
jgi:hypothetical protein